VIFRSDLQKNFIKTYAHVLGWIVNRYSIVTKPIWLSLQIVEVPEQKAAPEKEPFSKDLLHIKHMERGSRIIIVAVITVIIFQQHQSAPNTPVKPPVITASVPQVAVDTR